MIYTVQKVYFVLMVPCDELNSQKQCILIVNASVIYHFPATCDILSICDTFQYYISTLIIFAVIA